MDPSTIGKEVGHTLISKIKVKTKVKSSVFQVPVSSSAYGSSGSLDITTQSPLGPSGHTRSRQKTVEESVEREREKGKASFLFLFFFFLFLFCFVLFCFLFFCHLPVLVFCSVVSPFFLFSFFLLTNEWSFHFCSLSASQTPRELKANPLVMMWYGPLSLVPFYCLFCLFFFSGAMYMHIFLMFYHILLLAPLFFCKSRCLLLRLVVP